MRWLFNLGYVAIATVVVALGAIGSMLLSVVTAAVSFIALVGGAIAIVTLLIKEFCESRPRK